MLPIGFCFDFSSFWIAIPPYQSGQNEVLIDIISAVKNLLPHGGGVLAQNKYRIEKGG